MKTLACDQCEKTFEAETFEGWFKLMKAHYASDHADIMADMMKNYTKEDGEKWMKKYKAQFEAL
jgi:bisphosphoglycerate-dependent phosphoglycerate mutase